MKYSCKICYNANIYKWYNIGVICDGDFEEYESTWTILILRILISLAMKVI